MRLSSLVSERESHFVQGLFLLQGESFLRLKHKCESNKIALAAQKKQWLKDNKLSLAHVLAAAAHTSVRKTPIGGKGEAARGAGHG